MTDIIMPPKKNLIIDNSVFSTFQSCPRLMDFRYNHSFMSTKGKSNSLEVGSLVHKVLEVYHKHIINGFRRDMAINQGLVAGQLYITGCPFCADFTIDKPECKHEPGEYPGLRNTPQESDRTNVGWAWALQTCQDYFDFYKNDHWVPLASEIVKGDVLYEDDEIRILWKAKLDLIVDTNQGIYPVDHKTMKQRRQKTKLSNQFIGQCLVMKTRGVFVNKIGFQTSLKPEERFIREMIPYSADALLEWQSETLPYYGYKLLQHSEAGYWPPDYTHCDTMYGPCIFKDVCEANKNMREEVLRNEYQVGRKWDPSNMEEE
jgi:hypothetical protein